MVVTRLIAAPPDFVAHTQKAEAHGPVSEAGRAMAPFARALRRSWPARGQDNGCTASNTRGPRALSDCPLRPPRQGPQACLAFACRPPRLQTHSPAQDESCDGGAPDTGAEEPPPQSLLSQVLHALLTYISRREKIPKK